MLGGYWGRYLEIDLSTRKTRKGKFSPGFLRTYVGGKALGARLLLERVKKGVDPLSPENVLIFATGPLTGTNAPCTSRFAVVTKSPATNGIVCGNSGGDFGIGLKRAGYDCLMIRGASKKPVWVEIDGEKVAVRDASKLWGLRTEELLERLKLDGGLLAIGPAGENLVKFASILSLARIPARPGVLARGGVGAVMGSKRLKCVAARGRKEVPIANPKKFKAAVRKFAKRLTKHPTTGHTLPNYGTMALLDSTNAAKVLPTRNWQKGSFERFEDISPDKFRKEHLVRNTGCVACPIRCGRLTKSNGKLIKGPEYETMLFGANLENRSLEKIIEWNYLCDGLGMDTISAANVIGFLMEATERGIVRTRRGVRFGEVEKVSRLLEDIASRRGLGKELAEGVKRFSEKYGGEEFAIHVKGLEPPNYEPRNAVGQGLAYAVTNRGACHLSTYPVYVEAIGPGGMRVDPHTAKGKAELAVLLQDLIEANGCTIMCMFSFYALVPSLAFRIKPYGMLKRSLRAIEKSERLSRTAVGLLRTLIRSLRRGRMGVPQLFPYEKLLSAATGERFDIGDLMRLGEKAVNLERVFNVREGFSRADDRLPYRWLKEKGEGVPIPMNELLDDYYRARGWTLDGKPKAETLEKLGLAEAGNWLG